MAGLDTFDTSAPREGNAETSVEEITFRRNREIGGEELTVTVTQKEDGHLRSYAVDQSVVDANYDGSAKKLKTHIEALISSI